jgi:outer membrane protein
MKKLYLLIPVICLLSLKPANAQFEQGKIMVSVASTLGLGEYGTDLMSLGFTTRKIKDSGGDVNTTYSTINFNLLPRVGYFVIDNLAVGAALQVGFSLQKSKDSDYKDSESLLAIGPFARYYYPLEKIYPFVEANVGFGTWKEKWSNGSEGDDKEGLFSYGVGIGASKPVGENVLIDALVGYMSQSWKDPDNDYKYVYGTIGLRIGITILFGQ